MYPEIVLEGKYNYDQRFLIDYDPELALAGLPPYYVHRTRYKGDKMKNQRKPSELPIPEPKVIHYGHWRENESGHYFADVVFAETFEEATALLGEHFSGYETKGRFVDNMQRFRKEREKIDKDARIAHEDEKLQAMSNETGHQQLRLF